MVPGVRGSYEEVPPTLTDLAVRDRRWCQGNLQHAAVLSTRGLRSISRLHLLTGIGSYLTAPLWLLFILTGILIAVQARFVQPDYFPQGKSLFPQWPVVDPVRAMWMFVGTMALLLLPKLFGVVAVVLRGPERRGCGGMLRLLAGLVLETIIAGLMAPVVMLTQTIDVVAILRGRDSGWSVQRRDGGGIPARETARLYRRHTVLWRSCWVWWRGWCRRTSRRGCCPWCWDWRWRFRWRCGRGMRRSTLCCCGRRRRRRLASVVARASVLQREWQAMTLAGCGGGCCVDTRLLQAHQAMLPPPRRPRIDPIDVTVLVARTKPG